VPGAEPAEVQQVFAAGKFVVRECAYTTKGLFQM
jgi:hypothetical protein